MEISLRFELCCHPFTITKAQKSQKVQQCGVLVFIPCPLWTPSSSLPPSLLRTPFFLLVFIALPSLGIPQVSNTEPYCVAASGREDAVKSLTKSCLSTHLRRPQAAALFFPAWTHTFAHKHTFLIPSFPFAPLKVDFSSAFTSTAFGKWPPTTAFSTPFSKPVCRTKQTGFWRDSEVLRGAGPADWEWKLKRREGGMRGGEVSGAILDKISEVLE